MRATKSILLASTILSAVGAYNLSASAAPLQGEMLAQAAPAAPEQKKAAPAHPAAPAPPKPAPAPPHPPAPP
ncbi:MAG: hypothetical protein WBG12_07415, partial [Xanthobacteraceae bacterium]